MLGRQEVVIARINVDRHVLTEIVANRRELKKYLDRAERLIKKACEAEEREAALFQHLVNSVEEFYTGKGTESVPSVDE